MSAKAETAAGHAGQMDAVYRYQRHFYDITRKYYLLGRDRLIADLDPPEGGSVVEIGCGTGRNLILAARRYPKARLYGLDISEEMLATARAKIARAGLDGQIVLAQGDAARFDPARTFGFARFDRAFMSYTLSMIPPWRMAIAHLPVVLAPGGAAHILDFGQQERLPRAFRAILFAWLARFHVEPRGDLREAVESLAAENEGLRADFAPLYRGYAWNAVIRRLTP